MATILSSLAGSCIQKVQDIITEEAIQILGVKQDLKELQETMKQIQCFLKDADRRRIEDSAVSNWIGELKDAMYDADDIIDLVRFKGSKLLGEHPSSSTTTKLTACNGFPFIACFSNILTRHEIAVQIRSFNRRIERITELGTKFKFETEPVDNIPVSNMRKTSHLVEPNLVGKEIIQATNILAGLVLEHGDKKKAYKIGIVGTGGVGKTTLAQKLYNDHRVKGNFKKHAWICVSQQYTLVDILKEILRNIGVHQEQGESVGELKSKLAEAIEETSFFLVLDDLWQSDVWTNFLRTPLNYAAEGIIVVTTRHDTVAKAIGVEHMHRVELMSEEVGWELLWKSMNINDEKEVHNLWDTGMDIVRKCSGLPLAIRVVASVLSTKETTETEWQKILSNDAWSMEKLPAELRGALYLSYDQLPQNLKQCFLYCSLYPEDWIMHRDDLVRLWVAENFVDKQDSQLLEDTAKEYYYELISRNLLLPDYFHFDQDRCKMHDLLRQLGHHLSREECFCGDLRSLEDKSISKLRRVSVVTDRDKVVLTSLDKPHFRARTFINFCGKSLIVDHSLFKRLSYVHVLDLSGSSLQNIPNSIGSFIHLRLLCVNRTKVACLPESIGSLKNLQTLNLQHCDALHRIPSGITQLCNLRRLGLYRTPINQVPRGIDKLKFLNDLEGFPTHGSSDSSIRMQDGWNLEELGPLSQLRKLHMIKLEQATPCSSDLLLVSKRYLKVLYLLCTECEDEPYSEEKVSNIEKLFEQLVPPCNLELLVYKRYFGRRLPTWLASAVHLPSLKLLELKYCKSCAYLPPIGQLPNLKYLRVKGATAVTKIGPEFLGCGVSNPRSTEAVAFPKLESLIIWVMPNLEEWTFSVEEEAAAGEGKEGEDDAAGVKQERETPPARMQLLPCLKQLDIVRCPKLSALPWQLGHEASSLKELQLRDVNSLKVVVDLPFLSETLLIQNCDALERVSNVPQVKELYAHDCPNLKCVEKLDNLQQLLLDEGMQEVSSQWLPGLQEQRQKHHGEDLGVYNWA